MSDFIIKRADGKTREVKGYVFEEAPASAVSYKASISQLPKKVDLRPYMTKIEDQGNVGSCTANAVAGAYEYIVKRTENLDEDYDASRLFIYYGARAMRGNQNKDSGSVISDAIKLLTETGVCSEYTWPYSDDKKVVFCKPNTDAYSEANEHKITETEHINTDLKSWKSALAEGYPIIFGTKLFQSFDQQRKKGFVPTPSAADQQRGAHGNHAMLCVGYSDVDIVFIVRNSWGTNWGDNGYCYMSYDYLMNKNYNHGDSWIIRAADPVSDPEDNWIDDDESILTDLNEEFANMDDEDWANMIEEMGDLTFAHRLGILFASAAIMDDNISKKERKAAIEHLAEVLDTFGYDDLDPEGVFDTAIEAIEESDEGDVIVESAEMFKKYLSYEALANLLEQLKEVAGADGLDAEEADMINTIEELWMSDDDDDEEDEEDEEGEEGESDEDEDEDEEVDLDSMESFQVTVGGPESDEPSFISVCNQDAYTVDDDEEDLDCVEIVFNGKNFISADECKNEYVSENECAAEIEEIEKGSMYSFATNTGYAGYISVDEGTMKSKSSEISITVYYEEVEEDED